MSIKVGTFTQKTSTGTQSITGLGFVPQIILFFSSGATSSGSYQNHFNAMFGMTAGTAAADNGSVSCSSEDNKTTGTHNTTGRAAQKAITICEFGEVIKAEADLNSFDADGFTLNWTTADATARIINYIAVSGFDSVKIVEWKLNADSGNQSITGVGFVPDAVIDIHEFNAANTTTPYINATGGIGIGAFTTSDQWALGTLDKDLSDTINASAESITSLFQGPNILDVRKAATFVSMDADGFTINVFASSTSPCRMYSLCLKGGPQVKVGNMTKPSNVLGVIEETINFRLGGLILASTDQISLPNRSDDSVISFGVADRDSQHSMEFFSDELVTSNTAMVNIVGRGIIRNTNHDATIETQGFVEHFSKNAFRVNFGIDSNSEFKFNYIAFEETARTGNPLVVNTGVFDKKTSNGSQVITGIGFTPKVLMCWYGGATADDTWQDFLRRGFGAATSTSNRYACGDSAEEGLTTSNTQTTRSIVDIISIVAPGGTLEGEADLTSFDSDGFTLDWTNSNATAYKIHYLALGGDEVEDAKIVSFVTNTGVGIQSVTGVGFRPNTIICFGNTRIDVTEDIQHAHGGFLLAVTDGFNHVGVQNFLLDASATENHARTIDIDGFLEGTTSGPGEDLHTTFKSMDDDGFTFQNVNPSPSPGYRIFALCIKGVLTNVGNFNSPISTTGNLAYTGIGFRPVGLLNFGVVRNADDSVNTRGFIDIGSSDGTNQNALMSAAERGSGDLGCISKVGSMVIQDHGALLDVLNTDEEGSLTSFDNDGFTVNWTTSAAGEVRNLFMAFEQTISESITLGRQTQEAVEVLLANTATGRQTQQTIETLVANTANGRMTQLTVELLINNPGLRSTQEVVEVLSSIVAQLRQTQEVVETLFSVDTKLRNTQLVTEVLFKPLIVDLVQTQEAIEVLRSATADLVQTQEAIEVLRSVTSDLVQTQEVIEVLLTISVPGGIGIRPSIIFLSDKLHYMTSGFNKF